VDGKGKLAATFYYPATDPINGQWVRLEVKPEIQAAMDQTLLDLIKKYGSLNDAYFNAVRKMSLDLWEKTAYQKPEDIFNITGASWKIYPAECQDNDSNINKYYSDLKNFISTTSDDKAIVSFIDKNECVKDASVKKEGNSMTITATWQSTGRTLTYKFSPPAK
jgi:hypothetical protein